MKKLLLLLLIGFAANSFAQSAVKNTSTTSMCGCPGEGWNFNMPYKPWVQFLTLDHTKRLMHTNYGFNIPATASITGIQIDFGYSTNNPPNQALRDSNATLLFYGNLTPADDKSATSPWYSSSGQVSFGGAGDVWGMQPTPADVNDIGFGFNIRFYTAVMGTVLTFSNGVNMTVFYNNAAGVKESQSSSQGLKVFHSNRMITIENTTNEKGDLEIFDLTGKSVLKNSFEGNKSSFDTGSLPEGVYIYKVNTVSRSKTARIVFE